MTPSTPNPGTGDARIALTAYATASVWAHYGFEYADWFDSRRGRALFWPLHTACRTLRRVAPGPGAFTETLYWRHRWFSAWAMAQAPALAIEIGAGLSTRGIAYARRNPDCRWVDYDLPGMVAARRARLAGRELPPNYSLEAGDLLASNLGASLAAPVAESTAGSATGATIALTEGVIVYLDKTEKQRAFHAVATLLGRLGGGRYLLEVYPRDRLAGLGPTTRAMRGALHRISGRGLGAQLFADADEALALLQACGFARARVLADVDLEDAAQAPPECYRPFVLIEAET